MPAFIRVDRLSTYFLGITERYLVTKRVWGPRFSCSSIMNSKSSFCESLWPPSRFGGFFGGSELLPAAPLLTLTLV